MSTEIMINPEHLAIARMYLNSGSIEDTAKSLSVPIEKVESTLCRKDVKSFVDNIWLDQGYRNRNKIFAAMEKIIDDKLAEMQNLEITSSKDILEIFKQYHQMVMDYRKLAVSEEQARHSGTNVNIQNNTTNYNNTMERLMTALDIDKGIIDQ